jgi:hypothetical protein
MIESVLDAMLFEFVLDVLSLLLSNSFLIFPRTGMSHRSCFPSSIIRSASAIHHQLQVPVTFFRSIVLLSLHIPSIDAARRVSNNLLDHTPLLEIDECLARKRAVDL